MPAPHTLLPPEITGGLGEIRIEHPPGTFALTPASLIAVQAIVRNQPLLHGTGLDWGSGTGPLAIVAARIPAVARITGLEIVAANVAAAIRNAELNDVAHRVRFLHANSYEPYETEDRAYLDSLAGSVDFVLANPPSSTPHGDGFEFRRAVLRGGKRFLKAGGIMFLSFSEQYGQHRLLGLCREIDGFQYSGLLASTDWVPFDLQRPDLRLDIETYARQERRGGHPYEFRDARMRADRLTAEQSLDVFRETGTSPLSRWQVHQFTFQP